jgi:hypothetical protein
MHVCAASLKSKEKEKTIVLLSFHPRQNVKKKRCNKLQSQSELRRTFLLDSDDVPKIAGRRRRCGRMQAQNNNVVPKKVGNSLRVSVTSSDAVQEANGSFASGIARGTHARKAKKKKKNAHICRRRPGQSCRTNKNNKKGTQD